MKKLLKASTLGLLLAAAPLYAHHAAEGIVDDEVWQMIDDLVADTPHADLVFEDMGSGMTDITLTTNTITAFENMVDDGLLSYVAMLDGEVDVQIEFSDQGGVVMTISQEP